MRLTRGENDLDEAEARVQDLKQKADMFRSLCGSCLVCRWMRGWP